MAMDPMSQAITHRTTGDRLSGAEVNDDLLVGRIQIPTAQANVGLARE